MDDLKFGTRNKRGDYAPNEPLEGAPLLAWPPRPLKVLRWLPHYFVRLEQCIQTDVTA